MDERYVKLMQNNPQYQMAMGALQQGGSTDPIASPYAGVARALQGVMGGVAAKNQMRQYNDAAQTQADFLKTYAQGQGQSGMVGAPQGMNGDLAKALMQPPGVQPPMRGAPPANPMQAPAQTGAAQAFAIRPSIPTGATSRIAAVQPPAQVGTGSSDYDRFKQAIIAQESGGKYGVMNAEGSGAMGVGQVMPQTARNLAKRIGVPYREDLMKGTSAEARQYQDQITEAAIRDAYNSSQNDVDRAHYYYGGSNRKQWGERTRKYGQDILRRLGQPGSASGAGGGATETGVIGPQTPAPSWDAPELPQEAEKPLRPEDRAPAQSGLLDFGLQMLGTGNQAMMAQGMELVDKGLQEKFQAEREAIARQYGLDTAEYSAATENYYGSKRDNRQAQIAERRDVLGDNRRMQGAQWERGNAVEDRERGIAVNREDAAIQQKYGLERIREESRLATEARLAEVRAKGETRRDGFWTSPTGAKEYTASMAAIGQSDEMNGMLDEFEKLNSGQTTGGMFDVLPVTAEIRKWSNDEIRIMDGITNYMAPKLREAGSGAMSDRDVEMYKQSVPNTRNSRETNATRIEQIRRGNERIKDFHLSKLMARDSGNEVNFARDWSRYINEVSAFDGKGYVNYETWKTMPKLQTKRR